MTGIIKRERYWHDIFTCFLGALTWIALTISGPLLFYTFSNNVFSFIFFILLGIIPFIIMLTKLWESLTRLLQSLLITAQRFEGLSYFDRELYEPGGTINFKYADRKSYFAPEAQLTVSLRCVQEEATWWLENNPLQVWKKDVTTSAYSLSKGIKIPLPFESIVTEKPSQPTKKASYFWEVIIKDEADHFRRSWRLNVKNVR